MTSKRFTNPTLLCLGVCLVAVASAYEFFVRIVGEEGGVSAADVQNVREKLVPRPAIDFLRGSVLKLPQQRTGGGNSTSFWDRLPKPNETKAELISLNGTAEKLELNLLPGHASKKAMPENSTQLSSEQ